MGPRKDSNNTETRTTDTQTPHPKDAEYFNGDVKFVTIVVLALAAIIAVVYLIPRKTEESIKMMLQKQIEEHKQQISNSSSSSTSREGGKLIQEGKSKFQANL